MKRFADLSEQEILALAITNEEEDSRIYRGFAEGLREKYPKSAEVFEQMAEEEVRHRTSLFGLYRKKFGDYIPLIRRQDVKGFVRHRPLWLVRPLGLDEVRKYAETMEYETARFYRKAAERARDVSVRELLVRLAEAEDRHENLAGKLGERILTPEVRAEEDETARRMFVLQYVQPGLAGLMDGSVSTLAPLFAAAFATHSTWETFLVGLAASVGAGISMGFAEALSDDGSLTGRGSPWLRGGVCGLMTTLGGLGHTFPYLIPSFWTATVVAIIVVVVELAAISYIRYRYMDTPLLSATFQVVLGGTLVFIAGILIGQLVNAMFTLAHLSDPHLGPLPAPRLAELASKRALGFMNWRAKRSKIHQARVLDALWRDLKSHRPDHVAVTGDLVNIALGAEFAPARAWLEALGPPRDVTLVPGNHDAYVRSAAPQIAKHWDDYMRGDGDKPPVDGARRFPFVRRRGPVALIGLSSAVSTPPFMATGRLGGEQIARASEALAQLHAANLFRVVLIHHPPQSVASGRFKRLLDADALRAALAKAGAELVLHGHEHVHSLVWFDGPGGSPIPVVGIPSASAAPGGAHEPAAYNLYRISRAAEGWTCEASSRGCTADFEIVEVGRRELLPRHA